MSALLSLIILDWLFFSLLVIGIVLITWFDETEKRIGLSHTIFVLLLLLIVHKMNFKTEDVLQNSNLILKYVGIYILAGIVWAFVKWYFYLKNILHDYKLIKEEALKEWEIISKEGPQGKHTLQSIIYETWRDSHQYYSKNLKIERAGNFIESFPAKSNEYKLIIPEASKNKSLIVSWIIHWPISLIWTMINDPVRKFVSFMFEKIKGIFQRMSDSIFSSVKKDFN